MYNIDFAKIIKQLLTWYHADAPVMNAWLNVLLWPLQSLYNSFILFKEQSTYYSLYNGRVAELEYILNNYYYSNGTLRIIYIEDKISTEVHFYNKLELATETLIYNTSESQSSLFIENNSNDTLRASFTVFVPNNLSHDVNELASLVNKYKSAGFLFTIETYIPDQNSN